MPAVPDALHTAWCRVGQSVSNVEMLAAMKTLESMFESMAPLYAQMSRIAVDEGAYGMAFATQHLMAASEQFLVQLDKFVKERL